MSRIGLSPVAVPAGVQIDIKGSDVAIKGPKGEMARSFSPDLTIKLDNGQVTCGTQLGYCNNPCAPWDNASINSKYGNGCKHRIYQGSRNRRRRLPAQK